MLSLFKPYHLDRYLIDMLPSCTVPPLAAATILSLSVIIPSAVLVPVTVHPVFFTHEVVTAIEHPLPVNDQLVSLVVLPVSQRNPVTLAPELPFVLILKGVVVLKDEKSEGRGILTTTSYP